MMFVAWSVEPRPGPTRRSTPRTGRPVNHKLASVTVLGHTTMEADALATALMVMGPEEGYNLAQQQDISAFFIVKSDNGFVEKSTSAFTDYTR